MRPKDVTEQSKKNLIFVLAGEKFGISLSEVKEVIGQATITPVPDVPKFFCGLINLRGRIISVLDLKIKIGFDKKSLNDKRPCIIISEIEGIVMGFKVDDVEEVVAIDESKIEKNPNLLENEKAKYISGVSRHNEGALTLMLDLHKLLDISELLKVQHLSEKHEKSA